MPHFLGDRADTQAQQRQDAVMQEIVASLAQIVDLLKPVNKIAIAEIERRGAPKSSADDALKA